MNKAFSVCVFVCLVDLHDKLLLFFQLQKLVVGAKDSYYFALTVLF